MRAGLDSVLHIRHWLYLTTISFNSLPSPPLIGVQSPGRDTFLVKLPSYPLDKKQEYYHAGDDS